ncbi:MAG TPA: 8-oxo-dGTP diphosphatase [Candidatus Wallbacteria bacterium]|nr:MAG: 8-oxo-dGTP diphosphatase [bacterium ADurb.Bin243]HPG57378.1 8-oxo-dGTP diphosphatase [Candidatus Wallbacteria bacterium]
MKLATLCYLRKDGKTLMLHRVKKENDMHEGKYNGLGGKFEKSESPEACAAREVFEESGLIAENLILKGVITFPKFSRGEDWYVFVFVIDKFAGKMIESNEGNLEWIDDRELLDLNLWDGDRIFLKWLDQNKFFSAVFNYENGILKNHSVNFY